jgi:monofunctional glycosyltransferase
MGRAGRHRRAAPHRGGKRPGAKPSRLRRLLVWTGAAIAAFVAANVVLVGLLGWISPPASALMLQQPGGLANLSYRWTDRDAIARAAALAMIAAEDQRFLIHRGFDFDSMRQALADHRDGRRLRGASTISQQVAKNLFLWPERSYLRKALEAWFTVLIETLWTKERILEIYLNVAEFGPGIYGVSAAAAAYFDKLPAELSRHEAALLAAVLPNPRQFHVEAPSAYVRGRQATIEAQMMVLERGGHYTSLAW